MCGIAGGAWIEGGPSGLSESDLERMVARLAHRGPDDSGTYRDPRGRAALGFRRLSIIDLAGSRQPLSNEAGTVWVVFNGEIYNYKALRHRLEAKGHTLKTAGDTEVLVHLYEDEGVRMFSLLRGMFAMAIWDEAKGKLVLARDRLGQKPLVFRHDAQRRQLTFASELKALLTLPAEIVPKRIDPLALDRYLTFGYVPHPRTILQGVHKLPPAHYAVWDQGRLTMDRYWTPDGNAESNRSFAENVAELRSLLSQAVEEQMIADVPLGAFLSGGIDSTIIVGLMRRFSSQPVKTFSIGFNDPKFDESGYAALAAKHLGTEHHPFILQPTAWKTVPDLADQFDEPFADSSALPTWHVSRLTREHVTVALTGDAGDELFAGYDRYRALGWMRQVDKLSDRARGWIAGPITRMVPASARAKTRLRMVRRLLETAADPVVVRYARWCAIYQEPERVALYSEPWLEELTKTAESFPEEADPIADIERAFLASSQRDPLTQAMIADTLTYLPGDLLHKVDMASMAHSLECRGPFLDHRVVELAMRMPVAHKRRLLDGSKAVLKRAFADLLPKPIRNRSKMGFGVPIDRWFRNELKEEVRAILLDPRSLQRGLFRPEAIELMIAEHIDGQRDHAYRLWALLMLELWFRRFGE